MNKLFVILFFCGIFTNIHAQEETQGMTHELSVNATTFLTQFVINGSQTAGNSPYLINYKLFGSGINGLRTGFGLNYQTSSQTQGNTDVETNLEAFNIRLGYERSINLGKRWEAFYGIDAIFGLNNNRVVTESDNGFGMTKTKSSSNTTTYGVGPVLGFRFEFNERISLFTETTLYASQSETKNKTEFQDPINPFPPQESSNQNRNVNLSIPTSVFFAIRF